MTTVVTRFAPSPTGHLHLGNARTALFNWLYAKRMGGKFLLRIEDTDYVRSTEDAKSVIIQSLVWMGLQWDGDVVYQSQRPMRHIQVAEQLLASGNAYHCYMSQDDIAKVKGQNRKVCSPWRDTTCGIPANIKPVLRLKVKTTGITTVHDAIRGSVSVENSQLDDMILMRSDGTPTYMMAVVVDDHDMGVNYVIRGEDHFTNTFRQQQLYHALRWPIPNYAHLPLIHNLDGTKLSKRSGARSVMDYRSDGYLPEALNNYLLLLGWGGHGDQEIWKMEEVVKYFDVAEIKKSPARFDSRKLNSVNAHYMHDMQNDVLFRKFEEFVINIRNNREFFDEVEIIDSFFKSGFSTRIRTAMVQLKHRSQTMLDMMQIAKLYVKKQQLVDEKLALVLQNHKSLLTYICDALSDAFLEKEWTVEHIKHTCESLALQLGIKTVTMMQILRASVIGTANAPGVYDFMYAIGQDETIVRLKESM